MADEKDQVQTNGAEEVIEETASGADTQPEMDALRDALKKAEAQRDEYLRIAQRTQADFANYKRLNVSAKADAYDDGVRDTIAALLPTVDNLERALEAAKKAGEAGALTDGVEMTLKQALAALQKLGLTEIPSLGEAFDPDCHNAVVCCPGGEPGTIQEVFQKGYRARGRNIRCAMVRVAAEQ